VIRKSMSLTYELSSQPLHFFAKSSGYGRYKTVQAMFWPWLPDKSRRDISGSLMFSWERTDSCVASAPSSTDLGARWRSRHPQVITAEECIPCLIISRPTMKSSSFASGILCIPITNHCEFRAPNPPPPDHRFNYELLYLSD